MATNDCLREELLAHECECCAKEGVMMRKFQWKLAPLVEPSSNKIMKGTERMGYFCSRGHFWEESEEQRRLKEEKLRDSEPQVSEIEYGHDRRVAYGGGDREVEAAQVSEIDYGDDQEKTGENPRYAEEKDLRIDYGHDRKAKAKKIKLER